jgi:hypothetical protein
MVSQRDTVKEIIHFLYRMGRISKVHKFNVENIYHGLRFLRHSMLTAILGTHNSGFLLGRDTGDSIIKGEHTRIGIIRL